MFLAVRVITDHTFFCHEGFDLTPSDERNSVISNLPTFRVLKREAYCIFKSKVARHFGYPESRIRLWVLVNRQNGTL